MNMGEGKEKHDKNKEGGKPKEILFFFSKEILKCREKMRVAGVEVRGMG